MATDLSMPLQIPIEQAAAFAESPFEGNHAAVCPLESWLPDQLMQSIAPENNLPETEFYVALAEHHVLRWFSAVCEANLCGHATLPAAHVVFKRDPSLQLVNFRSRSGPLTVRRKGEELTMDLPVQPAQACPEPDGLKQVLGVDPVACLQGDDLLVVLRDEEDVKTLMPNPGAIAQLPGRGLIVTAAGRDVDFVSRFFAPGCGINENPVTGSAHCCLTPYWSKLLGRSGLKARQLSSRGGVLHFQLMGERVLITGRVIPYLSAVIHLTHDSIQI